MSLNEKRFNLRNVIYIFILINIFLLYYLELKEFLYLIGYEISLVVGFLIGVKGQGRFKQIMVGLSGIARNKKITTDEREHLLVMGIHHSMLELGYIYEERLEEYGLDFKKNGTIIKDNKKKKKR